MAGETQSGGAPETEAVLVSGEAGGSEAVTRALIARMDRLGVSRSELARRLGTSPAYVTKILRGDTNFTLGSLAKIAEALGSRLELRLEPAAPAAGGPAPLPQGTPRPADRGVRLPERSRRRAEGSRPAAREAPGEPARQGPAFAPSRRRSGSPGAGRRPAVPEPAAEPEGDDWRVW